ncbi:hypothetical protein BGZ99_003347 [Dissophora globulifera]|uniref:C2H2-type domain-containing protein n=1 Tax=Dissophora globulifera TaxID=979702 RepID=A0A9P6RNG6_9FUNG|nr:hypothetical protein BGZ99_003347 [Dissophora globulifera]
MANACTQCPETFVSASQLRAHNFEYHSKSITASIKQDGELRDIEIERIDGTFTCPTCAASYQSKSAAKRHFQRETCTQTDQEGPILDVVTVPRALAVPCLPISDPPKVPATLDHDFAVLNALQQVHKSEEEKQKLLLMMEAFDLAPFALKDSSGIEFNALTHPANLANVSTSDSERHRVAHIPRKRRLLDSGSRQCSPAAVPGLESLMPITPYAKALSTRKFIELSSDMCELVNRDWTLHPQLRYACAQVFAGSILMNTQNNQAIIANTVEGYGRTRTTDAHREPFVSKKGIPCPTSLPPPSGSRYEDVWPTTIHYNDGDRLVIGTQSCNILVTSSLRLDKDEPASVGGSTMSFLLSGLKDSQATKIFLDEYSVESALRLAIDRTVWCISDRNYHAQLRQLRSKFHDGSTYHLCRASGYLTRAHTLQPYSLFTLANHDASHSGDGHSAAALFHDMSKSILEKGQDAVLEYASVLRVKERCSDKGRIGKSVQGIIERFSSDRRPIPVIGNEHLNESLVELAQLLSTYIASANVSVAACIKQIFES